MNNNTKTHNSIIRTTPEISPTTLNAFGILITSERGYACEMIEMMNFAREAGQRNISFFISELNYSVAGICDLKILNTLSVHDPVCVELKITAHQNLSQYAWFGSSERGLPFLNSEAIL